MNGSDYLPELDGWRDNRRDFNGMPLVPGVNVDPVDVAAGCKQAAKFGYDSAQDQMVVQYALLRRRRGEEEGAQRTALTEGIDLTSWYAILAAAISAGTAALKASVGAQ